ncbi:hypothetical protein CDEST_01083 [Colletotrichum destructivum]|uniref:Secreted protein n=1 Tax=Colletotrichum destructivum TaxID=34406 RepID=A0AAX4HY90_9PEZI|nr:hypothetical protein CDEST_01083 [Colletotrichum destructivum]
MRGVCAPIISRRLMLRVSLFLFSSPKLSCFFSFLFLWSCDADIVARECSFACLPDARLASRFSIP